MTYFLVGIILAVLQSLVFELFKRIIRPHRKQFCNFFKSELDTEKNVNPFVVLEYLERAEKAALDILERREETDKTITLWWGLDGIRLNEDGSIKQVSRKKPPENVFYQAPQSVRPVRSCALFEDQTQSTRAQIDELMTEILNSQAQSWRIAQMQNALQQHCAQPQPQHPICCPGFGGSGGAQNQNFMGCGGAGYSGAFSIEGW